MKNILCVAVALFMLSNVGYGETVKIAPVSPKSGDLSLGVILGSPSGLSIKYWFNMSNAFDIGLGVPFYSDVKFSIHGDFHWFFPAANFPIGSMGFYLGMGGRVRALRYKSGSSADFGIRIPLGFDFFARSNSLNAFAEVVPVAVLAPKTELGLDGVIGIRYRFSGIGIGSTPPEQQTSDR